MVERVGSTLDRTFAALADPTRRRMLLRLRHGPASIGELAAPFRMTFAGVSKHLQTLERAGLVRREVRGRRHLCRLRAHPLRAAAEWTMRYRTFWEGRLDALTALVEAKERTR